MQTADRDPDFFSIPEYLVSQDIKTTQERNKSLQCFSAANSQESKDLMAALLSLLRSTGTEDVVPTTNKKNIFFGRTQRLDWIQVV